MYQFVRMYETRGKGIDPLSSSVVQALLPKVRSTIADVPGTDHLVKPQRNVVTWVLSTLLQLGVLSFDPQRCRLFI